MLKKKLTNKCIQLVKSDRGAAAIMYAIILPVMLGVASIAIDGSNTLVARARLADAVNEAGLAVAVVNNINATAADRAANHDLASRYINYYVRKGNQAAPTVKVTVNDQSATASPHIDYFVDATVKVSTFLPLTAVTGIGDNINVSNHDNNSGNVRKSLNRAPADIVFVVDFSGSLTCNYGQDCNQWTADAAGRNTRLAMLKQVVNDVVTSQQNEDMQFAIVPFDIGVPFRPKDAVNLPIENYNEVGGENVGCSVLYAPSGKYDQIDYPFWANKLVAYKETPSFTGNEKRINYNMDAARYEYYRFVAGPAAGFDVSQMVTEGWCVNNHLASDSPENGRYDHSCEANADGSIFTNENKAKIRYQYNYMVDLLNTMYGDTAKERFSIANIQTVNVAETIDNLFNTAFIQEFYQPWAPNAYRQRAFTMMCQSAQYNSLIRPGDKDTSIEALYQRAAGGLRQAKAQTFLIPLTANAHEKAALVSDFAGMTAGGGSDSLSGLLRSAPVAAQGRNKIKIIIVISDGLDDAGPQALSEIFHKPPYKVCDAIRRGLTSEGNFNDGKTAVQADSAAIHYISVNGHANENARMEFWKNNCGDGAADTVHSATNYKDLLNTINADIIATETGSFIRDNETP